MLPSGTRLLQWSRRIGCCGIDASRRNICVGGQPDRKGLRLLPALPVGAAVVGALAGAVCLSGRPAAFSPNRAKRSLEGDSRTASFGVWRYTRGFGPAETPEAFVQACGQFRNDNNQRESRSPRWAQLSQPPGSKGRQEMRIPNIISLHGSPLLNMNHANADFDLQT